MAYSPWFQADTMDGVDPNVLAKILAGNPAVPDLPMNSFRNESTGKTFRFPQQQPQAIPTRVVGYGGGRSYDLGMEDSRALPIDYTRAGIEIPGLGKGHYTADGRSAVIKNPDGSQTRVILGYDRAATMKNKIQDLEIQKAEADIAKSQEAVAASQQARTEGKLPTVPAGYRTTASGLEPIPGGPADFKQQGMFNADTATLQSSQADLDRLATSANELLKHPGLKGITGWEGSFPNIPGGQAADAEAKLATLKSQVGFGVLQAMRNASKTGGALGNVSDAEGKRLEANLAALDKAQSIEQFQQSLKKIVDYANGAKDRLANAYNLKYRGKSAQVSQPAAPASQVNTAAIPKAAISFLRSHPDLREQFDAKYGPGAADAVMQ